MREAPRRVLFLAPLKAPDHPVPSGDRTVARLYLAALERAGFAPELCSRLRLFQGEGGPAAFGGLAQAAEAEARAIIGRETTRPRPALVFTYHCYHRAPDLIGPALAEAFDVPHVIAEPILSPKQSAGLFADGYAATLAAVTRADLLLVATPRDRIVIDRVRNDPATIIDMPPFLDFDAWPPPDALARTHTGAQRLVTIAMMRPGDKSASYGVLATALTLLADCPWQMDIIGDGDMRPAIEEWFAPLGNRVRFLGAIGDRAELAARLAQADLMLWPAINEAYGMVLLEAAGMGLPVVAGDGAGVRAVVVPDRTGLLVPAGDAGAFAAGVRALLDDPVRRRQLGVCALSFARGERGLGQAAERLADALANCLARRDAMPEAKESGEDR